MCERGCANIVIDIILHSSDRETVRRASMALVNLALNCIPLSLPSSPPLPPSPFLSLSLLFISFSLDNNELLIFKSGILQKLLAQLNDRTDKELTLLASKTLVNLTTNGMKGEREKGRGRRGERGRGKGGEGEGEREGREGERRIGGEAQRPHRQGAHPPRFQDPC